MGTESQRTAVRESGSLKGIVDYLLGATMPGYSSY
jgi:hypothetical protein